MLQPADVASFKPLKSLWKKSVVEWRQQNPTENITLELIAPILKIALEKLSPEVTKNGFKACGLYPWNPDAVDYSKCLAPTKEHPQNTQHVNQSNTGSISYESYAAIVGDKLLQKLDSFNPEESLEEKSEEFIALHKVHKMFSNSHTTEYVNERKMIDQDANNQIFEGFTIDDLADIPVVLEKDIIDGPEIPIIDVSTNLCDSSATEKISSAADVVVDDLLVNGGNKLNSLDSSKLDNLEIDQTIMCIDDHNNNVINSAVTGMTKDISVSNLDEKYDSDVETKDKKEYLNTTSIIDCNMETSEELQNEVDEYEVLDLSVSRSQIPRNLSTFLQRPPTPKRKGKKITPKTSFAINSLEYKKSEDKKINQKKMELKKKEAKKQESLEKKRIAEKENEAKKLIKLRKKEETEKKKFINMTLMKMKKEKTDEKENSPKIEGKRLTRIKKQLLKPSQNIQNTEYSSKSLLLDESD